MAPGSKGVRRPGRRFRFGNRGIAEVVGTLMLILIVVAASIALAAFIASYQKQLQAQQAEAQQRGLESLRVLDIAQVTTEPSPNQLNLTNFSFVLASEFVNPSTVSSVAVNANPLRYFLVQNISPAGGVPRCYNDSTPFVLPAFHEVEVTVNANSSDLTLSPGHCPFSFFSPRVILPVNAFLQIGLFTILQNTFTQVFLPPTALPLVGTVSQFNGRGFVNVPVLDGSQSFQSGNGTLVSWNWTIDNTTGGGNVISSALGEKLVAPFASTQTGVTLTYKITLTLKNSNGLLGIAAFSYSYLT